MAGQVSARRPLFGSTASPAVNGRIGASSGPAGQVPLPIVETACPSAINVSQKNSTNSFKPHCQDLGSVAFFEQQPGIFRSVKSAKCLVLLDQRLYDKNISAFWCYNFKDLTHSTKNDYCALSCVLKAKLLLLVCQISGKSSGANTLKL